MVLLLLAMYGLEAKNSKSKSPPLIMIEHVILLADLGLSLVQKNRSFVGELLSSGVDLLLCQTLYLNIQLFLAMVWICLAGRNFKATWLNKNAKRQPKQKEKEAGIYLHSRRLI